MDEIQLNAIAHWHKTEIRKSENTRRGYYISQTKESISMVLRKAPKNIPHSFFSSKLDIEQLGII